MPNKTNYKVGPLSGEEVAGLNSLCKLYDLKPADMFRYSLAMLYKATLMEIENDKANNTDDANELREAADTTDSDTRASE